MTGRCERTVRSAVRELESAGLIVRHVPELRLRRARHATTVYRLLAADALPPVAKSETPPPPSPELVDVTARLAALVGRVDLVVPEPPVDLVADAEPPSVEFLPPELVDLSVIDLVADAEPPVDLVVPEPVAQSRLATVGHAPTMPPEPPVDLVVPASPEPPVDPSVIDLVVPEPPVDLMVPITGNPCRTREPSNLRTADQRAHATTDVAPVDPSVNPYGLPPIRAPKARREPFRAFAVPPSTPTPSRHLPRPVGAPTRPPPSALAAAAARCAALTRRRPTTTDDDRRPTATDGDDRRRC